VTCPSCAEVHQAAADKVLARALRDAPVRTGRLRSSLRAKGNNASAVVRSAGRQAPYAAPVHWGWPTRPNKGKGWRGGVIHPNPFLYEAVVRFQAEIAAGLPGRRGPKLMGKIKGAGKDERHRPDSDLRRRHRRRAGKATHSHVVLDDGTEFVVRTGLTKDLIAWDTLMSRKFDRATQVFIFAAFLAYQGAQPGGLLSRHLRRLPRRAGRPHPGPPGRRARAAGRGAGPSYPEDSAARLIVALSDPPRIPFAVLAGGGRRGAGHLRLDLLERSRP
jgi:hypothetical protein